MREVFDFGKLCGGILHLCIFQNPENSSFWAIKIVFWASSKDDFSALNSLNLAISLEVSEA